MTVYGNILFIAILIPSPIYMKAADLSHIFKIGCVIFVFGNAEYETRVFTRWDRITYRYLTKKAGGGGAGLWEKR